MNGRQFCVEILKKPTKSRDIFHNLQSHLACQYIRIYVMIRHIFYESLVKIYVAKHISTIHFCNIFRTLAVFWFIFIINLCRNFFVIYERKVLDQNEPCINTFQIILRNVCPSVILEFCLSSVNSLQLM